MIIQTIATDMDDTLLNEEGKISDYTLNVMKECVRRGIQVIPASGRAQASMERFVRQLDTGLPYIACNGAQLVNSDHTPMDTITFSAPLAREICAFLQQYGFYVQVYREDCFYYAEECEPALRYKTSSGMRGEAVGDLLSFLTFGVPKILSVHHPAEVARLFPIISRHFEDRVAFSISKPYFLEAEPPGVSKGAALARLADSLGIDPCTTVAFGDSLNDLSMLAFAKHSVAMGNAREEVLKAACYVCRPNSEDGLARFVEEHILNSKGKEVGA